MKTLYVPKGKTLHYERLECQTIIVDGTLVVDGAVRAKRITGKGLLDAGSVYSPAVSVRDLDTVKVVCDLLAAEYVQAVEVIVSSSAVVSRYLEAEYVEARKLTVSKHQISELRVEEFTYLPEKKRGVIVALLSGFFRRLWLSVRHRTPINAPYKQSSPNAKEESGVKGAGTTAPVDPTEAGKAGEATQQDQELMKAFLARAGKGEDRLADDFDFLKLKAMYVLLKDVGYTICLSPFLNSRLVIKICRKEWIRVTIINQTNRTLLLEEINPEKLDLLTLIGDVKGIDSLSDDKIKEINQHLECRSYEEFQEKFAPCIYSFFDANSQSVRYTLKKPENIPDNMLTEIPLNQSNDFLKMLFTLMESKKSQGVLNVDFGFENLLDMISPKKVMDDIRQVRKEIRYNYSKYAALEDGDPAKLDVGDKLNELFEEASNNYNNVMAMLPLAIEDIKTRLLLGAGDQKGNGNQIALGMLTMGEKGELKVLEAPKQETTALATVDDNINTGLVAALEEDYQAINETPSDYVQSLVVRTFCPLPSTTQTKIDVPTEVANYNSYLQFYKDAKDDFIKVVKPLVEKLLGVKMFFDQYKCKTKGW